MIDKNKNAVDFWEEIYSKKTSKSSGKPSAILEKYVSDRNIGTALELGCARGDDTVWLAKLGWNVTAVDISMTAINYAQENVRQNRVAERVTFEQHDLAKSFPDIECDLVSAMFLQSPLDFPRAEILKRAAYSLKVGGLMLAVTHQSVAPWSWNKSPKLFPTAQERLQELNFDLSQWAEIFVGSFERVGKGPNGETADLKDAVIALEKKW